MIRLWDYGCEACGKTYRDWPVSARRVPRTIACDCGQRAGWITARPNALHRSKSSLYGRFDPQFGCVVESYEHKRQLLREMGLVEMGVERHDDIMADGQETVERDPNVGQVDADSDEEVVEKLTEQLYTDPRIHRRHSGGPRPMLDSGNLFAG